MMPEKEDPFFTLGVEDVLRRLKTDREQGLSQQEVEDRRETHGENLLREAQRRSTWRILVDQFKSIVIIILAVAAILAFATARWAEGIALVLVVVVNTLIGFFSEWRAVKSMEALRATAEHRVRVRRDGEEQEVAVAELVPGDIVLPAEEQLVPADLRVIEADNLQVNEAALTGESAPVNKSSEAIEAGTPLAERKNMLFKGTSVTAGTAVAVAVATGMETELGRISQMAEQAESETPPLQQRLDQLGRRLAWLAIGTAIVVAIVGIAVGQDWILMIETALALGIAAVPEGLPIVATVALARGMWLMADRQALINRLSAVETLGATHVIFTDKTGTLTENRMTLRRAVTPTTDRHLDEQQDSAEGAHSDQQQDSIDDPLLSHLLDIGVLCNSASLGEDDEQSSGDPTEVALLKAGAQHGRRREQLLEQRPQVREVPFDSDVMMMATYHEDEQDILVAVKGAPRRVLEVCSSVATADGAEPVDDDQRQHWLDRVEELAGQGLRLLAMADKTVENKDVEPYEELRFVGLAGLLDPPREDVRAAIQECRQAGVRVVMVTGDQAATAAAIGQKIGIASEKASPPLTGRELSDVQHMDDELKQRILRTNIFARVSPEQKLNLIQIYQESGEVIAMTGDGVNDAPALKKADIGIAMGQRGTDAARQVSDMVLQDDRFATIVSAVRQGRVIFANIRKSVIFMICTNVAEIMIVGIASVLGAPLPLRPLQILFLNVLTDVFPALALGVGKGSSEVMQEPPRDPNESVLTRYHWLAIGGWSSVIAACVLAGFTIALQIMDYSLVRGVTVAFLTLGFAKLWFVLNLRDRGSKPWNNDIVRNPWIWGAIVFCSVLLVAAVYWPLLAAVLPTQRPGTSGWLLILGLSLLPTIIGLFLPGLRYHTAAKGDADKPSESSPDRAANGDRLRQRLDSLAHQTKQNQEKIEQLADRKH